MIDWSDRASPVVQRLGSVLGRVSATERNIRMRPPRPPTTGATYPTATSKPRTSG